MQDRFASNLVQPAFQASKPAPLSDPLPRSSFNRVRSSDRAKGRQIYVYVVNSRDRADEFVFELTRRSPLQIQIEQPPSDSNPDLFLRLNSTNRLIGASRKPTGVREIIQVRRNLPPGEYRIEVVLTSGSTVFGPLNVRAPRSPVLLTPNQSGASNAERMQAFLS